MRACLEQTAKTDGRYKMQYSNISVNQLFAKETNVNSMPELSSSQKPHQPAHQAKFAPNGVAAVIGSKPTATNSASAAALNNKAQNSQPHFGQSFPHKQPVQTQLQHFIKDLHSSQDQKLQQTGEKIQTSSENIGPNGDGISPELSMDHKKSNSICIPQPVLKESVVSGNSSNTSSYQSHRLNEGDSSSGTTEDLFDDQFAAITKVSAHDLLLGQYSQTKGVAEIYTVLI